jgi:hypothetical protein
MGPVSCPETSVINYQSTLLKIAEELRSHFHRGGSLKSRVPMMFSELPQFVSIGVTDFITMLAAIHLQVEAGPSSTIP